MKDKYDVVIIGAGIGGLVCGCYLAKAGLKVLIVEKNDKPGGYCSSFEKNGYRFDVGVHYLGSLREEGILFKILKELDLLNRIKFITNDPTDRIITPDKTIFIRKDKNDTKKELIAHFPGEKQNIEAFFKFILEKDFLYIVSKTKRITFKELLDDFFNDYKLKAILSILLGNLGLPSSQASALVSIVLYREFILDGGYYPKGGMQVLPDLLAQRFKEYGGDLLLSTKVVKIITKNRKIIGVEIENKGVISSKVVVSNADATLTFKKLLDCDTQEAKKVENLRPSPSAFVVYLGLNKKLNISPRHFTAWFFSSYDVEKCYKKQLSLSQIPSLYYALLTFSSIVDPSLAPSGKDIIRIFVGANFRKKIETENKETIYQKLLEKLENLIPNTQKYIEVKEIATPYTFYSFTLNREGALFGWAATPSQIDRKIFPPETSIKNLYLTGHWITKEIGQGSISGVSLGGRSTARLVLKSLENE